jgi:GDP-4-dehydro-6-deoxy-D-mannose reductase
MNNILVTGACGFIGTHLLKALNKRDNFVYAASRNDGDISLNETWNNFPDCDIVIHLAGKSFVPESWTDVYGYSETNLLSTIAALEYCKNKNAKLIFLSSYLYGNPVSLPISENAPLIIQNPYALTKKWAEESCEFYSNNYHIPVTIIRPFNVYGPGQSSSFLLPHIINQIKNNNEIKVKDLTPKRDYIYITDLINAIIKAIDTNFEFEIFNIGSGLSYSVGEIISMIQEIFGLNLPVLSEDTIRKGEIMNTIADISKAKQILNWAPTYDIYNGLKETIEPII